MASSASEPRLVRFDTGDYPFLVAATISRRENAVAMTNLTFSAPFDEGRDLLDSTTFSVGNVVAVRIGYSDTGEFTDWFYGQLNQGGNGLTLSPDGLSGSVSVQPFAAHAGYFPVEVSVARTPVAVLEYCAQRIGFSVRYRGGARQRLVDAAEGWEFEFGTRSYLSVIRHVCLSHNCTYLHGVDGDGQPEMLVSYEPDIHAEPPRVTFKMRGSFDPSVSQYPIMSWSPDQNVANWVAVAEPSSARGVRASHLSDVNDQVVSVVADAGNSEVRLGSRFDGSPPPKDVTLPLGRNVPKVVVDIESDGDEFVPAHYETASAASLLLRAQAVRGRGVAGFAMELNSVGIPELNVQDLVNVLNVGARNEGVYKVEGVTDNWSEAGWLTTFSVRRFGVPDSAIDQVVPAGGGRG